MSDAHQDHPQKQQLLSNTAEALGEHFDSIQIFAIAHEGGDDGGTMSYTAGTGNWYSRYGSVVEWAAMQDQRARNKVNSDMAEEIDLGDDEDEGQEEHYQ